MEFWVSNEQTITNASNKSSRNKSDGRKQEHFYRGKKKTEKKRKVKDYCEGSSFRKATSNKYSLCIYQGKRIPVVGLYWHLNFLTSALKFEDDSLLPTVNQPARILWSSPNNSSLLLPRAKCSIIRYISSGFCVEPAIYEQQIEKQLIS
ncbi:hypothetical protein L6164_006027 [Bauhinia variegata]|uniref:Uncharacterized protein n=1 Tax=Bauhinia variegata TaxID=167791 RepID=A0ACB9PV68_BAUVA|nr:hypothetical protein L6164_006027 [Bauhinia variegata]